MIIRKVKKHECSLIVQILKDSAEYLHQKGINQWKEPISEKEIADDIELKRVFIVQKILGKKLGIFSIKDYERLTATKTLFTELKKGEDSAAKNGWLDPADVRKILDF